MGRGNADGSDVSWTNTHVDAGNTLNIKSGRDTNMKGAVASGKQVTADIVGNLNIESLQDTSVYDSQQKSMGVSVSVPIAGPGGGGSVNASHSNINSNYASVMEQSGIKAGDGGYKVKVKGNTDLKGAVIAASDEGLKLASFSTGGKLTQSDIQNSASYNAESEAVSAGVGSTASASAGMGSDSGNASSTTKSGIGVSTKTDTTGAIAKIFDANKVTEEVNAQVQITQSFSQQAPKAVGDYATTKLNEARDKLATARDMNNGLSDTERAQLIIDAKALDDNWGEGGVARVALHTIVGALGGGLNGAMGAGATAVSTPAFAEAINKLDVPNDVKQALIMAAGAAVGAAAGGNAGAASGLGEVANNYLNHQQVTDKTKELANCKARECSTEERNSILQKYQSISDKNNRDGLDDMMTANGSVMPKYELDKEIADLNAMVTGPTACAADLGCRIEVSKSISQIKEVQYGAEAVQTFFEVAPVVMINMVAPVVGKAALEAMGLGSAVEVSAVNGAYSGSPFAQYMQQAKSLNVSTTENASVFYSGTGNRTLAEQFANANGRSTLEMTPGGSWLDAQKLFDPNSPLSPAQATQVWSTLSERFANGATGNAVGFTQGARVGSIFNTVEYPALLRNPNVANVLTGGH